MLSLENRTRATQTICTWLKYSTDTLRKCLITTDGDTQYLQRCLISVTITKQQLLKMMPTSMVKVNYFKRQAATKSVVVFQKPSCHIIHFSSSWTNITCKHDHICIIRKLSQIRWVAVWEYVKQIKSLKILAVMLSHSDTSLCYSTQPTCYIRIKKHVTFDSNQWACWSQMPEMRHMVWQWEGEQLHVARMNDQQSLQQLWKSYERNEPREITVWTSVHSIILIRIGTWTSA